MRDRDKQGIDVILSAIAYLIVYTWWLHGTSTRVEEVFHGIQVTRDVSTISCYRCTDINLPYYKLHKSKGSGVLGVLLSVRYAKYRNICWSMEYYSLEAYSCSGLPLRLLLIVPR